MDAVDALDLEETPAGELPAADDAILDQATAARSLAELRAESGMLQRLEGLAPGVRHSGTDTKWHQLADLLGEIFTPAAISNRIGVKRVALAAGPIPWARGMPRRRMVSGSDSDVRDWRHVGSQRIRPLRIPGGGRGSCHPI
jgi:hypothetical protein